MCAKLTCLQHQDSHSRLGLDCPQWIFEAVNVDAVASTAQRQRAVAAKDQRDVGHSGLCYYFPVTWSKLNMCYEYLHFMNIPI